MNKLLLTVDHQFVRTPDGKIWVKTIYGYDFWRRYLRVFDKVRIAARVREEEKVEEKMLLASGRDVEFFDLPQYRGTKEYVLRYFQIQRAVLRVAEGCCCAIFRIPSPISDLVKKEVVKKGLPWGTEIVNDPWDNFAPGTLKSILRPVYRYFFTRQVKEYALRANGTSYVTEFALQERYPSYARIYGEDQEHFESYYSSIILKEDYLFENRIFSQEKKNLKIVHVNSCITDFSKGHDIVIKVVEQLRKQGLPVSAVFVGDGPKKKYFEEMAERLGIGDYVSFTGLLSGAEEVRKELVNSDILIFPTLGEGLPRTVIEGMAAGLPCLSTPVNGIPELLEKNDLIDQKDDMKFAERAYQILTNEDLYLKISKRNIEKAREYCEPVLEKRRREFYEKLLRLSLKKDGSKKISEAAASENKNK